jgi:hypothetical protein
MKLLLERWQEYLNEGMKTVGDLPEGIGVTILKSGEIWEIYYSYLDDPRKYSTDPSGEVEMELVVEMFDCAIKDAWHMRSNADSGWGPLLYDVAMEWATLHGSGLMPDRAGLSSDSEAVWQHYYDNRKDVKIRQMDDLKNTFTPQDDSDNCKQYYGISNSLYDLEHSPFSKLYTKEPTTIQNLKKSGRLIIIK